MEDIQKNLTNISALFPLHDANIANRILHFMKSIPEDISHLRVQLTLRHLYLLDDNFNSLKLDEENNHYAQLIHDLFPVYCTKKIIKKLKKYGNVSDRCRLVIRNILKSNKVELDSAMLKIFPIYKRKLNDSNDDEPSKKNKSAKLDDSDSSDNEVVSEKNTTNLIESLPHADNSDVVESSIVDFMETDNGGLKTKEENGCKSNVSSLETIIASPTYKITSPTYGLLSPTYDISSPTYEIPSPTYQCNYDYDKPCCSKDVVSSSLEKPFSFEEYTAVVNNQKAEQERKVEPFSSSWKLWQPAALELESEKKSVAVESSEGIIKDIPDQLTTPLELCDTKIPLTSEYAVSSTDTDSSHLEKIEDTPDTLPQNSIGAEERDTSAIQDVVTSNTQEDNIVESSIVSLAEENNFAVPSGSGVTREIKNKKMDKAGPNSPDDSVILVEEPDLPAVDRVDLPKPPAVQVTRNNKVIYRLMEILPDVDPNYIRQMYDNLPMGASCENVMIDMILDQILEAGDYPKRQQKSPTPDESEHGVEDRIAVVMELLPDADPAFVRTKVLMLPPDELTAFVTEAIEKKNYPLMKDSVRKQQRYSQVRQYTTEFAVENFIKSVPDPSAVFSNPNRKYTIDNSDRYYIQQVLKNIFNKVPVKVIYSVLDNNKSQPWKSFNDLNKIVPTMKCKRGCVDLKLFECNNIPLLQELAYISNQNEILDYLQAIKNKEEKKRAIAKKAGLMLTCNCCFDDEVFPGDSFKCNNNCVFCRQCIIKSVEVIFGEGKLNFPCLGDCGSEFGLHTLQEILPPNLFSKVAQKKALAEIKAAGIEDLEFCPFCDFATIPAGPPETDRIFNCQNPECLKESCRLCKEPSHVPLRCDEVEKDDEVKNRVYIENKMTEALLRKCWKCGISFYKEEGCNKMTCSCGATMCYICGKAVTNYKHFNGLGSDNYDLCPLYSDTVLINQQNVLKGAEKAKEEIGVAGTSGLKVDPTADVEKHFEERKNVVKEPYLEQLQRLQHQQQQIRLDQQQQRLEQQQQRLVQQQQRLEQQQQRLGQQHQNWIGEHMRARYGDAALAQAPAPLPPRYDYRPPNQHGVVRRCNCRRRSCPHHIPH